jgi:SNF2 family DNA or RNA helicase
LQTDILSTFTVDVPILGYSAYSTFITKPSEQYTPLEALDEGLGIQFSLSAVKELINRIRHRQYARREWVELSWQGLALKTLPQIGLVTPYHLKDHWQKVGMIPFPYQLETARKVIEDFGGRAILADEVGLGKTIEAGLILKEYLLRGQAQKVLILCPAALIWQWYYELKEKFMINTAIQRSEYDWERAEILIASLDTAKRPPHSRIIQNIEYDLLILDEAHKIKNDQTVNHQLISGVDKKFFLMLTATPLQNDIKELYNLINTLIPGYLGTYSQFSRRFILDKRVVMDSNRLKKHLSGVMIRNRRGDDTVKLPKRTVESQKVTLYPEEKLLYDSISQLSNYTDGSFIGSLAKVTLQREVCSSSPAMAATVYKMMKKCQNPELKKELADLHQKASVITNHGKVNKLLELITSLNDQVIVFTEYKATQQLILRFLEQRSIAALGFDGELSSSRKSWIKDLFKRYGQVLVSTESGGEGLNFQFCCRVINYDLPWNPMKLEQRIGRVHRLGQTKEVQIINLATENTIEEYILFLLYEKIRLFEMAIGELDHIISQFSQKQTFEDELARILAEAASPGEIKNRLEELSARFDWDEKKGRTITIDDLLT